MRLLSTYAHITRDEMRRCGTLKGPLGKDHISSPSAHGIAKKAHFSNSHFRYYMLVLAAEELLYAWPVLCLVFTLWM